MWARRRIKVGCSFGSDVENYWQRGQKVHKFGKQMVVHDLKGNVAMGEGQEGKDGKRMVSRENGFDMTGIWAGWEEEVVEV